MSDGATSDSYVLSAVTTFWITYSSTNFNDAIFFLLFTLTYLTAYLFPRNKIRAYNRKSMKSVFSRN